MIGPHNGPPHGPGKDRPWPGRRGHCSISTGARSKLRARARAAITEPRTRSAHPTTRSGSSAAVSRARWPPPWPCARSPARRSPSCLRTPFPNTRRARRRQPAPEMRCYPFVKPILFCGKDRRLAPKDRKAVMAICNLPVLGKGKLGGSTASELDVNNPRHGKTTELVAHRLVVLSGEPGSRASTPSTSPSSGTSSGPDARL
jgi:hypothetical protein